MSLGLGDLRWQPITRQNRISLDLRPAKPVLRGILKNTSSAHNRSQEGQSEPNTPTTGQISAALEGTAGTIRIGGKVSRGRTWDVYRASWRPSHSSQLTTRGRGAFGSKFGPVAFVAKSCMPGQRTYGSDHDRSRDQREKGDREQVLKEARLYENNLRSLQGIVDPHFFALWQGVLPPSLYRRGNLLDAIGPDRDYDQESWRSRRAVSRLVPLCRCAVPLCPGSLYPCTLSSSTCTCARSGHGELTSGSGWQHPGGSTI